MVQEHEPSPWRMQDPKMKYPSRQEQCRQGVPWAAGHEKGCIHLGRPSPCPARRSTTS